MKKLLSIITILTLLMPHASYAKVDKDVNVAKVQAMLAELCYKPGIVDGAWGNKTETAVKAFFAKHYRKYDGNFDVKDANFILSAGASAKAFGSENVKKCLVVYSDRIGNGSNNEKIKQITQKVANKNKSKKDTQINPISDVKPAAINLNEIKYRVKNWPQNIINSPVSTPRNGLSVSELAVKDYKNQVYKRNEPDCGKKFTQKGDRSRVSVLSVINKKNIKLKSGHFDCSTQNTIWIEQSENIILEDISAWNGSDNALEIRDSKFVIIKNSVFGKNRGNKCIETENSIVILYNVYLHDCIKAFAGERTSKNNPEFIIFLNSKLFLIPDRKNYSFVCDSRVSSRYGQLIVSKTMWTAKNVNCPISSKVPDGLIKAILNDDLETIRKIVIPIYEKL